MKKSRIRFAALILLSFILTPVAPVAAAEKVAVTVNDSYTFFAIPFTLTHKNSQVVVPKTALRDRATSTSVGYTLKTPEGLRQKAGLSIGAVVHSTTTGDYVLYVLYKDTTPTSRVNTLAITHLPFLLVSNKTGTTSQQLNRSELRRFTVSNPAVLPVTDTE